MKSIKRVALAVLCIIAFTGVETYAVNAPVNEDKVESKETKEIIEINNRLKEIDIKINEAINSINELKGDGKEQVDRDNVSIIEYELKLLELRKEWEKEKYEIRLKKDSIGERVDKLYMIAGTLFFVLTVIIGASVKEVYSKIKRLTEEKIKNEYTKVIEEKIRNEYEIIEKDIKKLVEKCTEERFFIDNYKICVVSYFKSEKDLAFRESEQFIESVIKEYDTEFYYTKDPICRKKMESFDLIILNDEVTENGVAEYVMNEFNRNYKFTRDKYYFYLGKGKFMNEGNMECDFAQEKISFANAKSQFYGNLLNLMRIKRKLEENKNESVN